MRVTTRWDGFTGAPGFTVMHFRDFDTEGAVTQAQVQSAHGRVSTFFGAVRTGLPSTARLLVRPEVEIIEDSTGELLDVVAVTGTNVPIAGSSAVNMAGPAGAVINWRTNGIRNGRRIRGRTFLVPLTSAVYQPDGTLDNAFVTTLQNAANALVDRAGTPDLGVYARPSGPGATDGRWVVATSATVPDMVAVLRSRRD